MHWADLTIIVAYLVVLVAMGLSIGRRVHDAHDFFLARRSLTWWVIGLSIIGTNVSASGYLGAAGGAYNVGIAQANFEWVGAIPAMIVASLIFIPLYWRSGVYSVPEYLGRRYGDSVRPRGDGARASRDRWYRHLRGPPGRAESDPPAGVPAGRSPDVSLAGGSAGSRAGALARLLVRQPVHPAAHSRRTQRLGLERLHDVRRLREDSSGL